MRKNNFKRFIVFFLLYIVALFFIGAETVTFDLEFIKPPTNKFFFSNPNKPNSPYGTASARGVVFPDPVNNKSTVDVGITYKIESNGKLEVFCNSKMDLKGTSMMATPEGAGVDFSVTVKKKANGKITEEKKETFYKADQAVYTLDVSKSMTKQDSRILTLTLDMKDVVAGQYSGFIMMKLTSIN